MIIALIVLLKINKNSKNVNSTTLVIKNSSLENDMILIFNLENKNYNIIR